MGVIAVAYGIMGLLLTGLSVPMMYDKIPPNAWYGFRTPRTLSDPDIWYAANRVAGRNLAVAGVIVSITALLVFAMHKGISVDSAVVILLAVTLTSLIGAVVHSFIALRRM